MFYFSAGEDLGPPMIGAPNYDEEGRQWRDMTWQFRPSSNQSNKFIECGVKPDISIKRAFHVASKLTICVKEKYKSRFIYLDLTSIVVLYLKSNY